MSDYPLSGLDYARAKPPGRPQVEPVFKGSPYAAGPRYSGGATNAPIAPAKPLKSGAMANATAPAPAPAPKAPLAAPIPPTTNFEVRPPGTLASLTGNPNDTPSAWATAAAEKPEGRISSRKILGNDVYANNTTANPMDQAQYGRALFSNSFKGATKAGFAEGSPAPKPLSEKELKDRQLYWQQVRAGVDNDITRRALTRAAFNRGGDTMTENGVDSSYRQGALAALAGTADNSQRAAQFAQTADMEKQKLDWLQFNDDRDWQAKQPWFKEPAMEAVPDNATPDQYAEIQARNAKVKANRDAAMASIMNWLDEKTAAKQPVTILDAYQAPENAGYAEYIPNEYMRALFGGKGQSYADGGPVYQQPDQSALAQYQEYAARMQETGAAPVPFETFVQMQAGAMQLFADGGPVAGKMVIDTDPNAPVDSIPATIDGNAPAQLNSGEFVFPADVVSYFGTARLDKMIEAARKGAMAGAQ